VGRGFSHETCKISAASAAVVSNFAVLTQAEPCATFAGIARIVFDTEGRLPYGSVHTCNLHLEVLGE